MTGYVLKEEYKEGPAARKVSLLFQSDPRLFQALPRTPQQLSTQAETEPPLSLSFRDPVRYRTKRCRVAGARVLAC